jgi:hypothetical protein
MPPSSLTGINQPNEMNLMGKMFTINQSKRIAMKQHIISAYIIPLYSNQWDILNTNSYLIDANISQLQKYNRLYKSEDLTTYIELLKILKILIAKNNRLDSYENNAPTMDKSNLASMIYRTTNIRLMPEYEIYHHIIGKPDLKTNEPYNQFILEDIRFYLTKERITFEQINQFIRHKYIIT